MHTYLVLARSDKQSCKFATYIYDRKPISLEKNNAYMIKKSVGDGDCSMVAEPWYLKADEMNRMEK